MRREIGSRCGARDAPERPPSVARSEAMTTIKARYDASAERYRRWWEPVLAPTALALLDGLGPGPSASAQPRILDLGTGAGLLALEAVRRWPAARVVGIDVSSGMLGVANGEAEARLTPQERARLELVAGDAGRLPFPDGSFDLVVSSFVLQLVADRSATLREVRRVLASGGRFASVTWLVGDVNHRFAPDEAFEDALDELDIGDEGEPEEARSGDFVSAAAAAAQLRRAGFRRSTPKSGSSPTPTIRWPTSTSSRSTRSARSSRSSTTASGNGSASGPPRDWPGSRQGHSCGACPSPRRSAAGPEAIGRRAGASRRQRTSPRVRPASSCPAPRPAPRLPRPRPARRLRLRPRPRPRPRPALPPRSAAAGRGRRSRPGRSAG